VPLLYSLAWFLLMIVAAVAAVVCLLLLVFLLAFAWRAPRRHRSMSLGYCAVQTGCWLFVRTFYRVRLKGLENLPDQGGVLLIANHVAYVDVMIVGVLSPRPVRFLSWEGFERQRIMRFLTRMMGTIPVAESKAKDAIQKSADALKAGEVVCIFPEGSLTRNGGILPLRKGYELIARRAECPILPLAIDGMWGSLFSFSGGKFFWKMPKHFPRPVSVVIGQAYPAAEHAKTRNAPHWAGISGAKSPKAWRRRVGRSPWSTGPRRVVNSEARPCSPCPGPSRVSSRSRPLPSASRSCCRRASRRRSPTWAVCSPTRCR
jgi:1-acyl-sn-glycerol-3-phosphate acyltransferase